MSSTSYWFTLITLSLAIIGSGYYEYILWKKKKELRILKEKSSRKNKSLIKDIEKKIENKTFQQKFVGFIIAVFALLIFLIEKKDNFSDQLEAKENKDQKRFEAIIEKFEMISNPDTLLNSIQKGKSFYTVLSLNQNPDYKRKYISDIIYDKSPGQISLYLDVDNNLVFRIVDLQGETYTLKIAQQVHGLIKEKPHFIYCDFGSSDDYSFMRMFINEKEVGRLNLSSYVDFPNSNIVKKTIGSDITGSYSSSFMLSEIVFFDKPFLKKKIDSLRVKVLNYYN